MARRGRVIDFKSWLKLTEFSASVTADATQGGSKIDFSGPGTILRIRGSWHCSLDSTAQLDDVMRITCAIGIVSTDAATLGATALPDPQAEPEYPWLYWSQMTLVAAVIGTSFGGAWGPAAQSQEIDTKAMRRVKPGQSLVYYTQTTAATGAPVTNLNGQACRVLIGT